MFTLLSTAQHPSILGRPRSDEEYIQSPTLMNEQLGISIRELKERNALQNRVTFLTYLSMHSY